MDFRNAVIIMTSNVGTQAIAKGGALGFRAADAKSEDYVRTQLSEELKKTFRPEFLNRVDDVVFFAPLGLKEIEKIVEHFTSELKKRLAEQSIALEITPEASRYIASTAYDPVYGARPLKRFIQKYLETPVSRRIIGGDVPPGATVVAGWNGREIALEVRT